MRLQSDDIVLAILRRNRCSQGLDAQNVDRLHEFFPGLSLDDLLIRLPDITQGRYSQISCSADADRNRQYISAGVVLTPDRNIDPASVVGFYHPVYPG
ncbi:hypothetical protein DBR24_08130 [Pseudomonas sp. HMWF006]|nr:hypothetical protein DBR24_08130 [Pseudomonas sp. HMWF006]PTT61200.1 hypothetical protein DBR26_27425 [Pseudomonas sp. HMWF007]PTT95340.1 hypothetical protein DBR29_00565 [Pseudomonas sp. HMWF005]